MLVFANIPNNTAKSVNATYIYEVLRGSKVGYMGVKVEEKAKVNENCNEDTV